MKKTERVALIKQRLETALDPEYLIVHDESEEHFGHRGAQGGGHYSVEITARVFEQKNLMERHRLVYQALGELMASEIHALRIRAKAPDESRD